MGHGASEEEPFIRKWALLILPASASLKWQGDYSRTWLLG